MNGKGREVTQWTEKEFVRNRFNIWFGSDMPKTIGVKEIIDNAIDQIKDKKCYNARIAISDQSIQVMDTGSGISMRKDPKTDKTHLYLAVGKLYTSSNYDGNDGLVGTNGVGSSACNFLSKKFIAGNVRNNKFIGYIFNDGEHIDDGQTADVINNFNSFFDNGFFVSAEFDNSILEDKINIDWLIKYIEKRVGELRENAEVIVEINQESGKNVITFNKIPGSPNYVKSWEEQIKEVKDSVLIKKGAWKYALAKEKGAFNKISSIIQGAPIDCSNNFNAFFEIEGHNIKVQVPYSIYYSGRIPPKYTDQTKRKISWWAINMMGILEKCPSLYNYFLNEAEAVYLSHMLKNSDSDMYWPAIGTGYKELIIAEGYSAISGIKAQRDAKTQACLALRGKILNVYNKNLKTAMRSPIVKEVLTVLSNQTFDKIIICTDADDHGNHICTLLLGLLATFQKSLLSKGLVYYCHTPLYIFEKGKDIKWSDDPNDCPKGWHINVNKGLGSLTSKQIKKFVTDPNTRDLWNIDYYTPLADDKLYFALVEGGKRWIFGYDEDEIQQKIV